MMKGRIPPKFGAETEDTLQQHYQDKVAYLEYYGEQKDKRQRYLNYAADEEFDVVIVFDSDDIIHPEHTDWNRFYKLISLAHDFTEGEAGILDMWCWIPSEEDWPRQYNVMESNTWNRYHRIHLNPGKQKYLLNHYTMAENHVQEIDVLKFRYKTRESRQV